MIGLSAKLNSVLALLRGLCWRLRARAVVAGTPRLLGPRCRLVVEKGAVFRMGSHCSFDRDVEIVVYQGGCLEIGDHVYVGHGSTIACASSIAIGSNTLIGDLVSVRDMNHRRLKGMPLRLSGIETRPVMVGENCWIGSKVTIAAGSVLGSDVTVAANAAVSGKFSDGEVLGGVPARSIGSST